MRIELSRIKDIPRTLVVASVTVLLGAAGCVWMFMDLSKRQTMIAQLGTEVDSKQQQVNAISPVQPDPQDEFSQALLNNMMVSAADEPQLFEELSRLASENGLEEITINSDPPTTIEDPALKSLGITRQLNLRMNFKAEYADAARFLGSIGRLQRSIVVRDVQFRRDPPKLGATVAFEVYQKGV